MKRWSKLLVTTMFLLISTTSSTTLALTPTDGETDGSGECTEALNEAAKLIARAEANAKAQQAAKETAESRRDQVILEKEHVEQERDKARGDVRRLEHLIAQKEDRIVELLSEKARPMPWWVGLGLHALELAGAVVGGVCLFNNCPVSTTVTALSVSAGALTLDITEIFGAFDHDD